jgi:plasmid stabilization system protein ParE
MEGIGWCCPAPHKPGQTRVWYHACHTDKPTQSRFDSYRTQTFSWRPLPSSVGTATQTCAASGIESPFSNMAKYQNLKNYHAGVVTLQHFSNLVESLRKDEEYVVEPVRIWADWVRESYHNYDVTPVRLHLNRVIAEKCSEYAYFEHRPDGQVWVAVVYDRLEPGEALFWGIDSELYEWVVKYSAQEVEAFRAEAARRFEEQVLKAAESDRDAAEAGRLSRIASKREEIESTMDEVLAYVKGEDWIQWSDNHISALSRGLEDGVVAALGLDRAPWEREPVYEELPVQAPARESKRDPEGFQSLGGAFAALGL